MPRRRTKPSSPSPGSGRLPVCSDLTDFELAFLNVLLRLSQERSIASGIALRDVAELLEPRRLVPNYRIYDHLLDALPRLQELHLLDIVMIEGRPRLQLTVDGARSVGGKE